MKKNPYIIEAVQSGLRIVNPKYDQIRDEEAAHEEKLIYILEREHGLQLSRTFKRKNGHITVFRDKSTKPK